MYEILVRLQVCKLATSFVNDVIVSFLCNFAVLFLRAVGPIGGMQTKIHKNLWTLVVPRLRFCDADESTGSSFPHPALCVFLYIA